MSEVCGMEGREKYLDNSTTFSKYDKTIPTDPGNFTNSKDQKHEEIPQRHILITDIKKKIILQINVVFSIDDVGKTEYLYTNKLGT